MTFSRDDIAKFDRIMRDVLPGVVPHGFAVVDRLDVPESAETAVIRGELDDGRKMAWIKSQHGNQYQITSA